MSKLDENDLRCPAVVFSPHFDDETLGCGGTILKKRRAGAEVKIAFMTDGSKSHRLLISEDELKIIRASEGIAAGRSLGLKEGDLIFLGFEETKLTRHLDSAAERVAEIIFREQPEEIFIPYYKDVTRDHTATNRIVVSVLRMYRRKVTVYEYPIWFWAHWPWVSVRIDSRRKIQTVAKETFTSALRLLTDFRVAVYIGDVLALKRAALECHKSQMTRLIPDPRWRTLSDVSNGEFLECFFQEHEIFRRYTL